MTPTHLSAMRSRSTPLPRRISALRSCLGALAAVLALAAGCEHPSKPAVPLPPKGDTPEAKLERVIDRLRFALHSAQGSAALGVKSQRDCSYRLIPPTADEARYTTEVTIQTRVVVAEKGSASPAKSAPKGKEGGEPAAKDRPETAAVQDKEKFLLVYDNDHWTLPTKPESQTLQICFDSALAEETAQGSGANGSEPKAEESSADEPAAEPAAEAPADEAAPAEEASPSSDAESPEPKADESAADKAN